MESLRNDGNHGMNEQDKPVDQRPDGDLTKDRPEPDALEAFRQVQGKKCAAHHRTSTAEVMALIRKHRKEG